MSGDTSELVEFLAAQPRRVAMPRYADAQELRDSLARDYVLLRFTETRGETELGVPLERARCDLSGADFDAGSGEVVLVGRLSLDFVDVECEATLDLSSLTGVGRLRPLTVPAS
ncbi:hypothetical protein [Xanthomonas bonasiae]|uniref:hypothetical protein n=1 Tax=Xanthomonas bonasiae TaxID=2810351 RepID=UPI001980EB38|nr:hypothetical protein [Xanthomonas bonasiae]MBN6111421.1 hypothetical protein [Xanthomonas bonasiae]